MLVEISCKLPITQKQAQKTEHKNKTSLETVNAHKQSVQQYCLSGTRSLVAKQTFSAHTAAHSTD